MTSLALAEFGAAVADNVGLLGLPTERSARRQLPGAGEDVLRTIAAINDELVSDVMSKRTAHEFEQAFLDAFPKYASLVMSFARIVTTIAPKQTIARLSSESLCELEADIKRDGLASFGADMRDRAAFTVWTLRKITSLLETLDRRHEVGDGQQEKDREYATQFLYHALTARFYVDCLTMAIHTHRPLYPDVLPVIDNGLRSAVNAYAWIKQAVDLRFASAEPGAVGDYWSEEDDEFLSASMDDAGQGADE